MRTDKQLYKMKEMMHKQSENKRYKNYFLKKPNGNSGAEEYKT